MTDYISFGTVHESNIDRRTPNLLGLNEFSTDKLTVWCDDLSNNIDQLNLTVTKDLGSGLQFISIELDKKQVGELIKDLMNYYIWVSKQ